MPTIVFKGDTSGVRRATQDVTGQVKQMGAGIQNALGAIGAGLSAAGAIAGLRSVINEMDGIYEAAKRAGISGQEMQVLALAAKKNGVEVGELEQGYLKLSRTIGDAMSGNKAAVANLAKLGLAASDFAGKDMTERFRMVSSAILAMGDESERAAAAVDMFGRSGARLLPTLKDLSALREDALGKGLIISDEALAAADRFNDSLAELTTKTKALVAESGLVPWLADLAEGLTELARRTSAIESPVEATGFLERAGLYAAAAGAHIYKAAISPHHPKAAEARAKVEADLQDIANRLQGGRTIKTAAPDVFAERKKKREADARAAAGAAARQDAADVETDKANRKEQTAAGERLRALNEVSLDDYLEQQGRIDKAAAEQMQALGDALRALHDVSDETMVEAFGEEAAKTRTRWATSVAGGALTRVGGDTSRVMDIAQASLDVQRNHLLEEIRDNTAQGAVFP